MRFALAVGELLHATRWPLALVMAASLLAAGPGNNRPALAEFLVLSAAGTFVGASLGRLLARRADSAAAQSGNRNSRMHGLPILSFVPLWETRRQIEPRRLALVAMPVMLAAPMGVPAGHIAMALAAWIPLVYLQTAMRESGRTVAAIRRWIPLSALRPPQLQWYARRLVVSAWLACGVALWAGWQVLS